SASWSFTWTVFKGVLTVPVADQANREGDDVELEVTAIATQASGVTYSSTGLPDGLALDTDSGLISGTIAYGAGDSGPCQVTVTAAAGGESDSVSFTWYIGA